MPAVQETAGIKPIPPTRWWYYGV